MSIDGGPDKGVEWMHFQILNDLPHRLVYTYIPHAPTPLRPTTPRRVFHLPIFTKNPQNLNLFFYKKFGYRTVYTYISAMETLTHIFTCYCIIILLYIGLRWNNKKFFDAMFKTLLIIMAMVGFVIELKELGII
jgi:hypothetical protein